MKVESAHVLTHARVTDDYRVVTLEAPSIAPVARPGQFVHIRVPNLESSVLRRPFSIYRADGDRLSILYKTIGAGTRALAGVGPGDSVNVIGPLGNGFPDPDPDGFPVLVAGGYGVAPLSLLAARSGRQGVVFIGGATAEDLLCIEDFEALGWEVCLATEDGRRGTKGLVTDVLDSWLGQHAATNVPECFACGPDGMLHAVGDRAIAGGWSAWLSLDKHMGCGVGACLACVQKIRDAEGRVAWKRVCRDGPVFEAREIVWS